MDLVTPLLEAYDRHVRPSEHTDMEDGVHVEPDGPVVRVVGKRQGFVSSPRDVSGVDDLDALIARQRDFYAARGEAVEWKTRAHDLPADLPNRLLAAGFVPDEKETVMVGAAADFAAESALPDGVRIRRTDADADMHRIAAMNAHVWGPDILSWLAPNLISRKRHLIVFVAEADGEVVSAGWLNTKQDKEFIGMFGGTTLPRWRGRGIYRALVATRARLAVELGVRYLWVDASDDSRPILERLGFTPVVTTTPYIWSPK
ncbi:GNAT family N-acetyltransferase [Actinosynnema sp. ALI-1.44]|nr:GNAT family N-acetyltransferase [Actinosynnema sp. ALI-1.44]